MDRKNAWIIACAIVAGFLLLGLTQVFAQRFPQDGRPFGGIGRYQVVRANADVTIILDTATGDLYRAVPNDIRPYNLRPRGPATDGPRTADRAFTDKDKADVSPPRDFRKDGSPKPDTGKPMDTTRPVDKDFRFRKDADVPKDGFKKYADSPEPKPDSSKPLADRPKPADKFADTGKRLDDPTKPSDKAPPPPPR